MKKKLVATVLAISMLTLTLAGCGASKDTPAQDNAAPAAEEAEPAGEETEQEAAAAENGATDEIYIPLIALGYSHQFWQAVKSGADQAAADYGVKITFEGPEQETMVDKQVDMLKTVVQNNPDAICMAAIDEESVNSILQEQKDGGIPIVGFDAGVGDIANVTCSVDNEGAGALAADHAAELLGGSGKIAVLGHSETTTDAVARVVGF